MWTQEQLARLAAMRHDARSVVDGAYVTVRELNWRDGEDVYHILAIASSLACMIGSLERRAQQQFEEQEARDRYADLEEARAKGMLESSR